MEQQEQAARDKQKTIDRLNKIEGQIRGIKKMMVEGRDCFEILKQIGAVAGALRSLQKNILETRVHHCIEEALDNGGRRDEMVRELVRQLGEFRF
jgi:DNA-binding FrmR family transcriptional regulator